jgi:hypothetical protein
MAIKLNPTKANIVIDLLRANGNVFTATQLVKAAGGDRRARSALSHARMAGIKLEAVRDGSKTVASYRTTQTPTLVAGAAAPKLKAAAKKAASPKVKAKQISKAAAAKAPKVISTEGAAFIAAKNLETIKTVHAKVKQNVRKHPITNRDLTDEQAEALDEFRALEASFESEEQLRNAARAAVRENLPKEVYAE